MVVESWEHKLQEWLNNWDLNEIKHDLGVLQKTIKDHNKDLKNGEKSHPHENSNNKEVVNRLWLNISRILNKKGVTISENRVNASLEYCEDYKLIERALSQNPEKTLKALQVVYATKWAKSFQEAYNDNGLSNSDIVNKFIPPEDSNIDADTKELAKIYINAIDNLENPFDGISINSLWNEILWASEDIQWQIEKDNWIIYFDKLPIKVQNKLLVALRAKYEEKLRDYILSETKKGNSKFLLENEAIRKLYKQYYNIWLLERKRTKDLNFDSLSGEDENFLQKSFAVDIRVVFWVETGDDIDQNLLKEAEERRRKEQEENQKLIEDWKERNRNINKQITSTEPYKKSFDEYVNIQTYSKDLQNATWVELAKNAWLWKQLMEQYNNNENLQESQNDEDVFSIARERFINIHNNLESYITKDVISDLYNQHNNTIKNLDEKARDWLKKLFQNHPDEILKIYNQLLSFPDEINNTREEANKNSEIKKVAENEDENDEAIWSVIDNIRNIFTEDQENVEWNTWNKWLKLKNQDPVVIEWDYLKISWEYDWADVIVRYNLKSGEIFMNSFLQQSSDNSKITLWNNSIANQSVWSLTSFDNILANSDSLNSQIKLLNEIVVDKSKKQSTVNSIIIKFMKTFNIVPSQWEFKSLDFDTNSNLFDFIQIINNTGDQKNGDIQSLEYFSDVFMPTIMKYSCLKWWNNNLYGSQKNEENANTYDTTFNPDNKNPYILSIRESANNFSQNIQKFQPGSTLNYDSNYQLWFANFINKNFTEWNKPNWKLSFSKMRDFVKHLETDNKES